jgi:hypothetical protein
MDRIASAPNLAGMTSMKRNVSFHQIEIREYQRTLGDNPAVSAGPPMALDWKYNPDHQILHVDDYEKNKKSRDLLLLPEGIRVDILKHHCDLSRAQINAVEKEINIIKRNRSETALISGAQEKRLEMRESASRKLKGILSFSKKKEEKKRLKNTMKTSGRRLHSMNDLYTAGLETNNSISVERKGTIDSPTKSCSSTEQSLGLRQEPASSFVPTDDDGDDDWGFGYDDDELQA